MMNVLARIFFIVAYFAIYLLLLGLFIDQYYSFKRHYKLLKERLLTVRLATLEWVIVATLVLSVLTLYGPWVVFILEGLLIGLTCHYFDRRIPLTRRSIRMIIMALLPIGAFLMIPDLTCFELGICLIFLPLFSLLWLYLSAIILFPIEVLIRHHYVQKARHKLQEAKPLTIIAITGSFGKTSMKRYLSQLLSTRYQVLSSPKSVNTLMGLTRFINDELHPGVEILILECGVDEKGGMDRLLGLFTPDIVFITGIGAMHLATFKSLEAIYHEKMKLAKAVAHEKNVYYNGDSELLTRMLKKDFKGHRYRAQDVFSEAQRTVDGLEVLFRQRSGSIKLTIPLFGLFQLSNLAGAVQLARTLKIDDADIAFTLMSVQGEPHRLAKRERGEMIILDDAYNGNEEGMKEGLKCLRVFPGTKAIITPGVVELDHGSETINRRLGSLMVGLDLVIIVGDDDHPLVKGYLEANGMPKRLRIVKSFPEGWRELTKKKINAVLIANDTPRYFLK